MQINAKNTLMDASGAIATALASFETQTVQEGELVTA